MTTCDYINGIPVKFFYTPIFNEYKKDVWHGDGSNTYYDTGDMIPTKTLYYNLPQNFLILSQNIENNNIEIHIIEDSRVLDTISINRLGDSFFSADRVIFNTYGEQIKIKSVSDCKNYIYESNNKFEELNKINDKISDLFNNILQPLYDLKIIFLSIFSDKKNSNYSLKVQDLENILNKNEKIKKDILDILNIKDSSDLSDYIFKIKDNNPVLADKLLKYIDYEIDINNTNFNELQNKNKPSVDDILKTYNQKWIIQNKFKKESHLGKLIDCFIHYYSSRYDKVDDFLGNPFEKYLILKNTIKDLLIKNPTLIASYGAWINLDEEKTDLIYSLCNFILKSNDEDIFAKPLYKLKPII